MVLLARPELIPVVELEPLTFMTARRESPLASGRDDPAAWRAYWKAALADRGVDLEPLAYAGSWSVPLADVTDAYALVLIALECGLVRGALAEPEEGPFVDNLRVLPGGYALGAEDGIVWHASCCSSLTDLADWRSLLDSPPSQRFLGHTWIRSADHGPLVELGMRDEYAREEGTIVEISRASTAEMFASAVAAVEQFRSRLCEALRSHVPEDKRRAIADELTRTGP